MARTPSPGGVRNRSRRGFCFPSTIRGPVTLNFGFPAMCTDALRNAGSRSSGGLRANFHGDNTGSNPVGDAKSNQKLTLSFARRSKNWLQSVCRLRGARLQRRVRRKALEIQLRRRSIQSTTRLAEEISRVMLTVIVDTAHDPSGDFSGDGDLYLSAGACWGASSDVAAVAK